MVKARRTEGLTLEIEEHLFAEWCGYTIAAVLGLPTPEAYIVEVPAEILTPLGSTFADIVPGLAFATELQSPSFQVGVLGFPRAGQIRNVESVCGMIVLDTILQNNDREEDVLAVPVAGTSQFELRYIDNTWTVYGPLRDAARFTAKFPRKDELRRLARGLDGLPPYLLAARTLDADRLTGAFDEAPVELAAAAPDSCGNLAELFVWRGNHTENAIFGNRPGDI